MARIAPFLACAALTWSGCALRTSNPTPVIPRHGDDHAYQADVMRRADQLVAGGKFDRSEANALANTEAAQHGSYRSPDSGPG